jgi:hypothetical protein
VQTITVVAQIFLGLVRTHEARGDHVRPVPPFDVIDGAVDQSVLRLELISVEQVVVDGAQMTHIVRSPRHADRARPGDVDHRRGLHEVVRGLEGRVALADDENPLTGEVARIYRHRGVELGRLDARDRRDVRLGHAGRDDQALGMISLARPVADYEVAVTRWFTCTP